MRLLIVGNAEVAGDTKLGNGYKSHIDEPLETAYDLLRADVGRLEDRVSVVVTDCRAGVAEMAARYARENGLQLLTVATVSIDDLVDEADAAFIMSNGRDMITNEILAAVKDSRKPVYVRRLLF